MKLPRSVKVIVLGAGASRPAGIPTIKEFLMAGLGVAMEERWEELKPLNEFLRKTRNTDLYGRPTISDGIPYYGISSELDRAIRITDIEKVLEEAGCLVKEGKLDGSILEGIHRFIFRMISRRQYSSSKDVKIYDRLIEQEIISHNGPLTIISFNYDTMLEESLHPTWHKRFSYKLENSIRENFDSYEKDYCGNFDFLKLHGSLNWLICPKCDKFTIRWAGVYRNDSEISKCIPCKVPLKRVLIPPAKGKEQYLEPIQSIWNLAEEALLKADHVIVIGYSFRNTDSAACNLFSKSLGTTRLGKKFSLTIVDLKPDYILERLLKLGLSSDIARKAQCFNSFEKFVSNLKPTVPESLQLL